MKTLDCRNMACPLPVLTVKRALEAGRGEPLQVLLDDGAPRENVTRFAVSRGFTVQETPMEDGYILEIASTGKAAAKPQEIKNGSKVLLITTDCLGTGPEELGRLLMKNFIITLLDMAEVPDRMLFLNTGIMLTTEGSEVLEVLEKLGNLGVEILSCGVCLDFFHRKDKLVAGSVTNMFTIAENLLQAGSVIRP